MAGHHTIGNNQDILDTSHLPLDLPFCLFLRLVNVCRRVPSRGAKGWRVTVAIVAVSDVEFEGERIWIPNRATD